MPSLRCRSKRQSGAALTLNRWSLFASLYPLALIVLTGARFLQMPLIPVLPLQFDNNMNDLIMIVVSSLSGLMVFGLPFFQAYQM